MQDRIDRRAFLLTTSSAALISALPSPASAAPRKKLSGGGSSGGSTGTPATPASWATAFNGGRSQVNLNFVLWGGDYPFINCLKTAQEWTLLDNSGRPDPNSLDSNGYPLRITNGGVYTVFDVPSQSVRPGNYVITWTGNGTIKLGMNFVPISGSLQSSSGAGRFVFSTTDSHFSVGISAIGSPAVSDLKVFHAADETALNAGEMFGAQFKQRLIEANFGVIRFLNWQNSQSNITTWATRKPVGYVFYGGYELRPTLDAGLATLTGSAYSATMPGFVLADKATVHIRFSAGYSGQCTMNINGTGDIPIYDEYARPLNTWWYPVGDKLSNIATLVYDATLRVWIKQGGDLARGSSGLNNCVPPEMMVQLCAEIGAHPYFVTPPFAIDPATDFMPSLAAYCRANGPTWMIPRFEGPNETWNFAGGFVSTYYAVAKANAYGWNGDYHNWYGKVMSVLGQIISSVYAGDRSKYQVICGVQTGYGTTQYNTTTHNPRLTSALYVAQATPPQAPYTKSPAYQWVTHICCANYVIPSEWGTAQEGTDAAAYAAAAGDPTLQSSIASQYASTCNSGSGTFTLAGLANIYANWKSFALSFGITKMCCYEGGYSPDYGGDATINALRRASKLAPSLQNYTTINYANFTGLSGNGFTAEFPSCFQLSGPNPSSSVWAVLEDVYTLSIPPQWSAIVAFNKVV